MSSHADGNAGSLSHEVPPTPLLELDGLSVLNGRRTNPFATWGRRDQTNRVEPVATPMFDVPFKLEPGEQIFTIGSCFARSIELKLMALGFKVPVRSLFKSPQFASVNPGIINNFGTPSIFNEIAWALDPSFPYDFDNNILSVGSDKYVDLHVIPSERPGPREEVVQRRLAIRSVTQAVKDCRVVIMTLGLVELWFDREQDLYLNATVMPSLIRKYPGRFSLRVLDFTSAKHYLDRALDLLRQHCRSDQQILLTVSPVPMAATFRQQDVMVANSYSKSLLRTVAEYACVERDNVHYYPSYECVAYSDRKIAWQDDLVHPTEEIVALNVSRMISAFVPADTREAVWKAEVEANGVMAAVARSNELVSVSRELGEPFFDWCTPLLSQSPDLAYNSASAFLKWGDIEKAEAALAAIPEEWAPARRRLLVARIYAGKGEHDKVIEEVLPLIGEGQRNDAAWQLLVVARAKTESFDRGRVALMEWTKISPKQVYQGLTSLAIAVEETSPGDALDCYRRAFASTLPQPAHALRFAELLIRENQIEEMREFLGALKFDLHSLENRRKSLLDIA